MRWGKESDWERYSAGEALEMSQEARGKGLTGEKGN
jgi:hypothetical protein